MTNGISWLYFLSYPLSGQMTFDLDLNSGFDRNQPNRLNTVKSILFVSGKLETNNV